MQFVNQGSAQILPNSGYAATEANVAAAALPSLAPEQRECLQWRKMHGHEDGESGVDNEIAEQSFAGIGAWILGRNILVLSEVHGRTTAGKVGGATSRRIVSVATW